MAHRNRGPEEAPERKVMARNQYVRNRKSGAIRNPRTGRVIGFAHKLPYGEGPGYKFFRSQLGSKPFRITKYEEGWFRGPRRRNKPYYLSGSDPFGWGG